MNNWIDYKIHPITGFPRDLREETNEELQKDYYKRVTYRKKYIGYINEDRSKRGETAYNL